MTQPWFDPQEIEQSESEEREGVLVSGEDSALDKLIKVFTGITLGLFMLLFVVVIIKMIVFVIGIGT